MKALLVGYGKMGKLIHSLAPQSHILIVAICDHNFSKKDLLKKDGVTRSCTVSKHLLKGVDVVIDFSNKEAIIERIDLYCREQVPSVIGVTDWEKEKEEAKKIIDSYKGACIASSNFSPGVLLLSKLVQEASKLFHAFEQYKSSITETHHIHKKDSPSGTALMLMQCLQKEIPITSIRAGENPGEHVICFDSADDAVTLTHQAKSRNGFANGALSACHFIYGKKGFYTFEDILKEILT